MMRLSLLRNVSRRNNCARRPPRSRSARQRTLALSSILPRAQRSSAHVLDLGVASPRNLAFFGRFSASFSVADLYRGLGRVRAREATGIRASDYRSLFPYRRDQQFDLIFAWDLLNYLKPDELPWFMDALAPHCRPGTVLHAFIYTTKDMPPAPVRFRIEDEETLVYDVPPHGRPSPRYHEQELTKQLAGFAVDTRYQLRSGIAEYVFSFRLSQRAIVEATTGSGASLGTLVSTAPRGSNGSPVPVRSPSEPAPRWRPTLSP
jgi:hypothetical protein